MTNWDVARVRDIAPNEAAFERGRQTAFPHKWLLTGQQGTLIWGSSRGSGKVPYETMIDLEGPAFQCSCPSRQLPCKHALGLLLLHLHQSLPVQEPPQRVTEWKARREARVGAAKPAARSEARLEARIANTKAGLQELKNWLYDAVRMGIADLRQLPPNHWDHLRARLVDAQAGGLTARVSQLQVALQTPDSIQEAADHLAFLYLMVVSMDNYDTLERGLQADIQTQLGISQKREVILQLPPIQDDWLVTGRRVMVEDRFDVQRTWLQGRYTNKSALLLEFAVGGRSFTQTLYPGQAFKGELCFYPSAWPLRALIKGDIERYNSSYLPKGLPLTAARTAYADALGQSPFISTYPMLLTDVRPTSEKDRLWLVDPKGQAIPLPWGYTKIWELLALSGGQSIAVMGEWDGQTLYPLAAQEGIRWTKL